MENYLRNQYTFSVLSFLERPWQNFQMSFRFVYPESEVAVPNISIESKSKFVHFKCRVVVKSPVSFTQATFYNSPAPSDLSDQLLVGTFSLIEVIEFLIIPNLELLKMDTWCNSKVCETHLIPTEEVTIFNIESLVFLRIGRRCDVFFAERLPESTQVEPYYNSCSSPKFTNTKESH